MLMKCFVYREISSPRRQCCAQVPACMSVPRLTGSERMLLLSEGHSLAASGGRNIQASLQPPAHPLTFMRGFFPGVKLTETWVQRNKAGQVTGAWKCASLGLFHLLTCKFWTYVVSCALCPERYLSSVHRWYRISGRLCMYVWATSPVA